MPQATCLPAAEEKGFDSSPACAVCMPDSHSPLSSGQEASCTGQTVTKFSWRLLSPCGVFPMPLAALQKDPCGARQEWPAWGPGEIPGPFLLLPLPLYFAHFFKLTQLQVRSETSPADSTFSFPSESVFGSRGSPFPTSAVWALMVFRVSLRSCRSSLLPSEGLWSVGRLGISGLFLYSFWS